MSIYSAMRAGVSGLNANSAAMAVISDNIANVNTPAYKRAATDFSALINAQAQATAYTAGGVISSSRRLVDLQGSIEQTSSPLDLAVSGPGFFIVTDAPNTLGATAGVFTRAGAFALDKDGRLVNSQGYYLLGTKFQNGSAAPATSLAALQPVDLSAVGSQAQATTKLTLNANVNSSAPVSPAAPATPWTPLAAANLLTLQGPQPGAPELTRTTETYDSLGNVNTLTFSFTKVNDALNLWGVDVYIIDPNAAAPNNRRYVQSGYMQFDTQGRPRLDANGVPLTPASVAPQPAVPAGAPIPRQITLPWATNANLLSGAENQTIAINWANITQNNSASALNSATVDGYAPGELVSATVNRDGILSAQFSNGRTESLYRIPIATFLNPNGLLAERGGSFRQTIESGLLTINDAGAGSSGAVRANALEASNVDLGSEFTTMITTQRAYSASSRIITTANEMLEELLQVVR